MKTIFITTFEGVEVKNILRTPIFSTLLKEEDVRLVLFMKSEERVEYYKKEFSHPRVFYEVVERRPLTPIDRWFTNLKFTMLRTETTKRKRKVEYIENKNLLSYMWDSCLNILLSQPFFTTLYRWGDRLFIKNNLYAVFFDKYKPDVAFLAHLFDEFEIDLLRESKQRKVTSIGLINSWDKVTSRSIIRLLPDFFIVFNEIVKEELIHYAQFNKEKIYVSGLPQYDFYFEGDAASRIEFFNRIGISPSKKLIVYAPLGSSFSNSDWDMIDLFNSHLEAGRFGPEVALLVRFQPNDFLDMTEISKRPWLHYDYPGKRFSATRGVDWDMDQKDLSHLKDTLTHMSLLVCFASSLSIDAAIFNKPVINIGFELNPSLPTKSATQYFEREHYKKALRTEAMRLVKNEEELILAVKEYLNDPTLDTKERQKLVYEQCSFTDGKSGERIGSFILKQIET